MYQQGINICEISRRFGIDRRTVSKYLHGDPYVLCRSNRRSCLEKYKDFIIACLSDGKTQSETARLVKELGYDYTDSNIRQYIYTVIKREKKNKNIYKDCIN